jgi:DNA-nicking Smr family endonuclease
MSKTVHPMDKNKVINRAPLKSSLMHNPFDRLKGLLDSNDLPSSQQTRDAHRTKREPAPDPQQEKRLFREAMEGVNPIASDHVVGEKKAAKPAGRAERSPESEAVSRLVRLVQNGEGFVVSDTPEYIEGTGYRIHQEVARRLHRGDFSIQAHIDLHGYTVESAKEAFDSFLRASINSGKRAVLIIHGRGLSSPGEPVLKNKVREWLSHGYWLKRVIAYASAQSFDGGAGATYVLLRNRPVSKRYGMKTKIP